MAIAEVETARDTFLRKVRRLLLSSVMPELYRPAGERCRWMTEARLARHQVIPNGAGVRRIPGS